VDEAVVNEPQIDSMVVASRNDNEDCWIERMQVMLSSTGPGSSSTYSTIQKFCQRNAKQPIAIIFPN